MANEVYHLGPANVYWDADGTPIQLVTEGGVSVALENQSQELFTDPTGVTPIEEVQLGGKASVTIQMADHDLAKLVLLFPNVTSIGTTTKRYEFRPATGLKLSTLAKALRLKKVVDGAESADTTQWFTLNKAIPTGSVTIDYTKDKQSTYPVTFKGLADPTKSNRYAFFGDPAAV